MTKISNPSACLCLKKEEHAVDESRQTNYAFNSLLQQRIPSPPISPFYTGDLLSLAMNREKDQKGSLIKVDSLHPDYKKTPDRGWPNQRVRILSNNIFDFMDIRHSTFSESSNDDVKLGLKKRAEILVKQLNFAVNFRITSLKATLIACSNKGLFIKRDSTQTQSGSYSTPDKQSFLKRSFDNLNLDQPRKFDECHVAAITSIKNQNQFMDEIVQDLRSEDVDKVIAKYSLIEQEPLIKLLKTFIIYQDQEKLFSEVCSQIDRTHFANTSCINIFRNIVLEYDFELKKELHLLAPGTVNELIKDKIIGLSRTDKGKALSENAKLQIEKFISEYNSLNPNNPLDSSKRIKSNAKVYKSATNEPVLLKLIYTLRKKGSNQLDLLMDIVNRQYKQTNEFRDFIFNSLGKDISDIKKCIFGHFLPINSLAGIMCTQTVTMPVEINHGIDSQTDNLEAFVSNLLTSFSQIMNPNEDDLQNSINCFKTKLCETYQNYAAKKNSFVIPKLEELINEISEPDEEMQKIFYQLDKDPVLRETVLVGLSYIGHLFDINQDKVTIGEILNYISDQTIIEQNIDKLNKSLAEAKKATGKTNISVKYLIETFTKLLNNFGEVIDKINQLNIPESIRNREIETAPYRSMHNFIDKNEASIAMFCAEILRNQNNFEISLLGKNLEIGDVTIVTEPVIDFHLCEGSGNQYCWERV